MSNLQIATPITLPCGLTLPNRLAKAAMAENWAGKHQLPQQKLIDTYGTWADGDWGLVMTGNVQVNIAYLGQPEDHAVNSGVNRAEHVESWRKWTQVTNKNNTPTIVQLNHPGRQSMPGAGTHGLFGKTIAPSAVPLKLGQGLVARFLSALVFGTPREMTIQDIRETISDFVEGAKMSHEAGFAGIEIHAAHGYLLAQFLSSKTNLRQDDYGGSAKKRARIIVEIIREIRKVVPAEFCVAIKFNSVDHQSEKELGECIEQLQDIVAEGIDFLEISGGTYENPEMVTGAAITATEKKESTIRREAFFLDFAKAIRGTFPNIPLMVTGGFRSRQGMEQAIREGSCDIIGLGRPAVLHPQLPKTIMFNPAVTDEEARITTPEYQLPWLAKLLGVPGLLRATEPGWYVGQIHKILYK